MVVGVYDMRTASGRGDKPPRTNITEGSSTFWERGDGVNFLVLHEIFDLLVDGMHRYPWR